VGYVKTALLFIIGLLASLNASAQADLDLSSIKLPPGFSIEIWSDEVPNARSLALGENGTVFAATRRDGRVYALMPNDNSSPTVITLAEDLLMPNGIAFYEGDLYVAENHRITRYPDIEATLPDVPEAELVIDTLSKERHHGWRYMDFGPDGKLYIAIGAPCA
jgi:glucose/arabinose dehydrogenase